MSALTSVPCRRGTTNRNDRGGSPARRRRREWLVETYRANVDLIEVADMFGNVFTSEWPVNYGDYKDQLSRRACCRCCRCGELLTTETVTVDRIVPGIVRAPAAAPEPTSKACTKCSEVKVLDEFYPDKDRPDGRASWCRTCNSRHRNKTPGRLIEGRARGRAYRLLALAHAEEFERLFEQETAKATAEHEQVAAAAAGRGQADAPVARLKTGPRRREETTAVQRLDVARCPKCHSYHDADHQVLDCVLTQEEVNAS